ncbi:Uncharacterised protein [Yersinia mollaretii]|uniref:Uncharacterized protein n=1 Tax=Yersinia mollaretii TaxID=33060 RepID=A0AA36LPK3_YERMO|nr:Uncharacterised protein [Yersinia mollaretii]
MDAERAVLEQERITAVRQRNDEPRAPTKWASDTCASAGLHKGAAAPFAGWFIGGEVNFSALTTELITEPN